MKYPEIILACLLVTFHLFIIAQPPGGELYLSKNGIIPTRKTEIRNEVSFSSQDAIYGILIVPNDLGTFAKGKDGVHFVLEALPSGDTVSIKFGIGPGDKLKNYLNFPLIEKPFNNADVNQLKVKKFLSALPGISQTINIYAFQEDISRKQKLTSFIIDFSKGKGRYADIAEAERLTK